VPDPLPLNLREQIVQDLRNGVRPGSIADTYNVSRSSVYRVGDAAGVMKGRRMYNQNHNPERIMEEGRVLEARERLVIIALSQHYTHSGDYKRWVPTQEMYERYCEYIAAIHGLPLNIRQFGAAIKLVFPDSKKVRRVVDGRRVPGRMFIKRITEQGDTNGDA
jgi:hypothetical protein